MSNELLNPVAIDHETLLRLENNLTLFKFVNREFSDKFAVENEKIGYTFNARVPVRLRGRVGDAMKPEDVRETVVPIVVNRLWGQDLIFSDQDLTMTVERFGERYIEPCSSIIANMIDGEGCDLMLGGYNLAGTAGSLANNLSNYTAAKVALAKTATPAVHSLMSAVVSPDDEASLLGFANNYFNPAKTISDQYMTGKMGQAVGLKFSMDQNIARQTIGLVGGTPIVAGANQTGSSLATSGWTASTQVLNAGDIVSVVGMNGVNPVSWRDTGALRTFVVTANVTSDGGGLATIPIAPPMDFDTTSQFQTVVNAPPNGNAIKVYNTAAANFANISGAPSAQNMVFHRDAMTLVVVRLEKPGGMEWSEEVYNKEIGLSCRLVRGYDIRGNQKLVRVDVLGGWKLVRPEFLCRVASA